jgi:hypothetical protein
MPPSLSSALETAVTAIGTSISFSDRREAVTTTSWTALASAAAAMLGAQAPATARTEAPLRMAQRNA